jgi:hypothetical protein
MHLLVMMLSLPSAPVLRQSRQIEKEKEKEKKSNYLIVIRN